MKKIILVLTLAFLTMGVSAQEKQPSINVSGEGIVKVIPDQVIINVRVENEGTSAQEVKKLNDEAVDKVIRFVSEQGVANKDVNTEYINLNKNYDYQTKEYKYVANQSISILLRDLDRYTSTIQGLLDAGVNRIDGVDFKSSDMAALKSQARIAAVKDAKKKAEEYSGALGMSVGNALNVAEAGGVNVPQPMYRLAAMDAGFAPESQQTIAVGEMAIKAQVTITFELK